MAIPCPRVDLGGGKGAPFFMTQGLGGLGGAVSSTPCKQGYTVTPESRSCCNGIAFGAGFK